MTTEQDDGNVKKDNKQKEEEKITQYSDGKHVYHIGDTVYIESQRPDLPYYICSIKDFKRNKKDNITVDVIWFYRPCEIPASVYQLLLQDRNDENGSGENILENPVVKDRELFVSDAIDIFPATSLRGHANCNPFNDIKEQIMDYISNRDNWYYILRYNPDTRRMANAKGEIRIGASHQATLPICIPYNKRSKEDLRELHHTCKEDLVWDPEAITDAKLIMYLRASQSITSYNGYWENNQEGGICIIDKNLNMVSEDLPKSNTYDILHHNNYDISSALDNLILHPAPKKIMHPWSEDERKKFMRGLRSYGKTFHKIRKELLPDRTTCDLIQYYYFWKKTAIACSSRPHKRGGRRHNVLARKTRTAKPKTTETSEFLELSSCSENEYEDSEESDNARDLSLYACRHCYATKSPNWHHAGKLKILMCHECRIYFKRYGLMRPLKPDEIREPPAYIYKAAFENLEEQAPYTGRMRTRRSSTPVFCNAATVRNRILHDAKNTRNKQPTPLSVPRETSEETSEKTIKSKRKAPTESDINESTKEVKKTRIDRTESDDAGDADDESEESESSNSKECSRSTSPVIKSTVSNVIASDCTTTVSTTSVTESKPSIQQSVIHEKHSLESIKQEQPATISENTFLPIKEENDEIQPRQFHPSQSSIVLHPHMQRSPSHVIQTDLLSTPPSPEVPDNLEKLEKINSRFKLNRTDPQSTCSRCERIYTFQRPQKQKTKQNEEQSLRRDKELLKRREGVSPIAHQPAQITSHYENIQRLFQQQHRSNSIYPYSISHEHLHRPQSPRDMRDPREQHREMLFDSKYHPLLKGYERPPTDHRPQHPLVSPHPPHPFSSRSTEPLDFRIAQSGRPRIPTPHISSNVEAFSRTHHPGVDVIAGERMPPIDRTMIEPPVSGALLQPQLHAHHHTHTHLHLHDDLKYRNQAQSESGHFDRHEHPPQHPTIPPATSIPPSSRASRELYELQHKGFSHDALAQAHVNFRELNRHHTPHGRESASHPTPVIGREGAASPSFPHDAHDPVAYHHYLTQMPRKMYPHASRHGRAPDLSPRGLPQMPRHSSEFSRENEREKHLSEKLSINNQLTDREKFLRAEQARVFDDKQMRHHLLLQERNAPDSLKMKNDLIIPDRYVREEVHSPYHYDVRRLHESRSLYERGLHPDPALFAAHERERLERERIHMERSSVLSERALSERALSERALSERALTERAFTERALTERALNERVLNERALHHERYLRQSQHDRMPHARSPMERVVAPHERQSIIGHYKPETIDLSGD